MKIKFHKKIYHLSFLVLLFNCSTNDIINDTLNEELETIETFYAKVNGVDFVSGEPYVEARFSSSQNLSSFVITAVDANDLTNGKAIGLTFTTTETDFELKNGISFSVANQDYVAANYAENNDYDYEYSENTTATIEITNVNTTNKEISGIFSFSVTNVNTSGNTITHNVTNGVFTDVIYLEE
ncbi:hypothetical protein [Neotamlana laminarinivorans]|uniref:Uncharacterized protein n=1 Tax=Neotamlana laminarinivorans TaxID=2883124 RepID=A0A9X1L3P1_9FLAO|nr:hypothetical protein [Tamlana laminarinivorans]MCB4798447.1 hypothetical protein [Tamlana laminarinivorans]